MSVTLCDKDISVPVCLTSHSVSRSSIYSRSDKSIIQSETIIDKDGMQHFKHGYHFESLLKFAKKSAFGCFSHFIDMAYFKEQHIPKCPQLFVSL